MSTPQEPQAEHVHTCGHCKQRVRFGDTTLSAKMETICWTCAAKEHAAEKAENQSPKP